MKKTSLILCAVSCVIAISLSSCKKDKTPPVITLNGDPAPKIALKQPFSDLGATALDDEDGPSTPVVSGAVDPLSAKIYTLTYTATDAEGNVGTASRTVTVTHTDMTTSGAVYGSNADTLTFMASDNLERVYTTRFANYDNTVVYFDLSGSTGSIITVPSQTVANSGNPAMERVFSGAGTISEDGRTITINYNQTINGTPATGGQITYYKPF